MRWRGSWAKFIGSGFRAVYVKAKVIVNSQHVAEDDLERILNSLGRFEDLYDFN